MENMQLDDEIVDEFDVYLNKSLTNSLHVFEFDSKTSPLIDNKCVKVMARPKHNMFEIETPIDITGDNYDRKKSEQLMAFSSAMTQIKSEYSDQKHSMSWKKIKSCEVKPTLDQYAIAMIPIDSTDIHITPIKSVIQFRPSFDYIDKRDIKLKQNSKSSGNKEDSEADVSSHDENETVDEAVQTIALRFAGPDEEKIKIAREKSFNYFQQQVAKDPYINVDYHSMDSERSSADRNLIMYNAKNLNANDSTSTANDNFSFSNLEDFLNNLKYQNSDTTSKNSSSQLSNSLLIKPCLSQIRLQPLSEQIRLLLINAKLLSFDEIKRLLFGTFDNSSVLKNVQMYACLVQGNWIVKSEVLYNKDYCAFSQLTGIPAELLCRTRDYILWRFTQTHSIKKKELLTAAKDKIPLEDIKEILSHICVYDKQTKCMNFLLPEDTSFIEKNGEVVNRQQLLWSNKYNTLERSYTNILIKTEDPITMTKITQKKRRNSRKSSSQVC